MDRDSYNRQIPVVIWMRFNVFFFMFCIVCPSLIFYNTSSNNTSNKEMVDHDNLKIITVKKGEKFEIVLDDHPGGYKWFYHVDHNIIKKVEENYLKSKMVGSPGQTKFTFEGLGEGESNITMINKRPWQNEPLVQIVYRINIIPP